MASEAPAPPPDDDATLMLAAQRGDEAAFATLVRRWQGRVVSLAYRYLGSAADAEDLAQDVFLRVHRARGTYEPSARFSTWIYRITVNTSLNFIRGRKARKPVSGEMPFTAGEDSPVEPADESAEDPSQAPEKVERVKVLRKIGDDLPERQRLAILLNKYEARSYEEVAASMDLTVMAVKSLLTRARVTIREKLEPYLESGALPPEEDEA